LDESKGALGWTNGLDESKGALGWTGGLDKSKRALDMGLVDYTKNCVVHRGADYSKWTSDLDRSKVALGVRLHQ
jgi:hypothetical protein